MNTRARTLRAISLIGVVALLSPSCGEVQLASGGIGGTGITQGPIEGFGSIFVNGVRWDTEGATLDVDGLAGDESDLSVGMIVTITGIAAPDGRTGTAQTVRQDDAIEGPVAAISDVDPDTKDLEVFGVTVRVQRSLTVFEDDGAGFSFDDVEVNDIVEVNGLDDGGASGVLLATHIEKDGVRVFFSSEVEIEGVVQDLEIDPGLGVDFEFEIAGVTVEVIPSTEFEDLLPSELAEGLGVEVDGLLTAETTIQADKIERVDGSLSGNFETAKLEGFVTDFVSAADFRVNGVAVDASAAGFEGGVLADLADGVRVEVEGEVVDGLLVAAVVEFEDEEEAEVEGPISSFVSVSSFVVAGQEIDASDAEEFRDGDEGDLAVGVFVDVRGVFDGPVLVARRVKFE